MYVKADLNHHLPLWEEGVEVPLEQVAVAEEVALEVLWLHSLQTQR